MHTVRDKVGSLRKNIEAKNGNAATADAKELQEVFQKVHDFWKAKNIPDAMRFSLAAQGGFQQVATAAAGGNFDAASAQMKETMANCAGCHNAHREKTADGFKIKY
jgi:mono/diheme cytochrome c family protein